MMSEVRAATQAESWQLGECWQGRPTRLAGHQGVMPRELAWLVWPVMTTWPQGQVGCPSIRRDSRLR